MPPVPIVDENGNDGILNIADTYSALTSPENFERCGHGSFVFQYVGSIYLQTYQNCGSRVDDCYTRTRITITGGDGKYECAMGTVDFAGTNSENVIAYLASFCLACETDLFNSSTTFGFGIRSEM